MHKSLKELTYWISLLGQHLSPVFSPLIKSSLNKYAAEKKLTGISPLILEYAVSLVCWSYIQIIELLGRIRGKKNSIPQLLDSYFIKRNVSQCWWWRQKVCMGRARKTQNLNSCSLESTPPTLGVVAHACLSDFIYSFWPGLPQAHGHTCLSMLV